MCRHLCNRLIAALLLAVAACASARQPSNDVVSAPLFDTTAHASLFRQLDSAMADTARRASLERAMQRTRSDTALIAMLERLQTDTAMWNQFDRVLADTTMWRQLDRMMADTAMHARLRQLQMHADSLWARLQPQAGPTRRP